MKKILTLFIVALLVSGAYAQRTVSKKSYENRFATNRFCDNWFIQAGVGGSAYLGWQNNAKFMDRVSPVYDIALGKWFTPYVGLRFQFNYSSDMRQYSNDFTSPFNQWPGGNMQKFNFQNLHSDLMFNLSSLIGGYKETRTYEAIPYYGIGWTRIFYKDEGARNTPVELSNHEWSMNVGLINKFRVSNSVDINLELRSTFIYGHFDKSTVRNLVDIPVAATVGVTYRFGKVRNFTRVSDICAQMAPAKVDNSALERVMADNKRLKEELEAARNKKPEVEVVIKEVVKTVNPSTYSLFFAIGKSTLDANNMINLKSVAQMIKDNPSLKFDLSAYCDPQTGTKTFNQELAGKRAKYVYDQLVAQGVSKDQLIMQAMGINDIPYTAPESNRVVVVKDGDKK